MHKQQDDHRLLGQLQCNHRDGWLAISCGKFELERDLQCCTLRQFERNLDRKDVCQQLCYSPCAFAKFWAVHYTKKQLISLE